MKRAPSASSTTITAPPLPLPPSPAPPPLPLPHPPSPHQRCFCLFASASFSYHMFSALQEVALGQRRLRRCSGSAACLCRHILLFLLLFFYFNASSLLLSCRERYWNLLFCLAPLLRLLTLPLLVCFVFLNCFVKNLNSFFPTTFPTLLPPLPPPLATVTVRHPPPPPQPPSATAANASKCQTNEKSVFQHHQ